MFTLADGDVDKCLLLLILLMKFGGPGFGATYWPESKGIGLSNIGDDDKLEENKELFVLEGLGGRGLHGEEDKGGGGFAGKLGGPFTPPPPLLPLGEIWRDDEPPPGEEDIGENVIEL